MGKGIVTLLGERHGLVIKGLWAILEAELGIQGLSGRIVPHFSHHVADDYDLEALEAALDRFAETHGKFRVRTSGLGLFTGSDPALYVTVVRSARLAEFHRELWACVSEVASGVNYLYDDEHWIPHITLLSVRFLPDDARDSFSEIARRLSVIDFTWEITVDNLSLLRSSDETGASQQIVTRFEFG
ncbi:MAG: 2'-5' RNA ligase family protein [Chloroflexi bacterium]|nr:2'-5' RNA ligase family protein [Chloroflexota bacterium]